ncbi:MAG: hypothetical protein KAU26_02065, partial [Methylococcales bacterium]|nr:hypothetical protein [Methylococcales bacterium]
LRVLKSHRGVVIDLAFSPDNRYLLSGSADTSVKVWDTQSWTLKDTLNTHSNHVHAVLMLNNPQRGYDIYSAADDNTVALHHFQHKTLLVKQFTAKYKLRYLATNGKHVAVSGKGKQIFIFNRQLKLQQTLNSDTQPRGLVYSPDGQTLMAGFSFDRRKLTDVVNLYRLPDYRKTISFKQHPNLTRSVAFLDNNTAVTGGGNNNEIFIWDKNTAAVKRKIVGTGQRILSVGIQDDALAWGNQSNYINQNDRGKLQNSFNLTNFQFQTNPKNYQRISTQQNGYSLNHSRGGNYGYADAILNIQQQGKTIAKITRDTTTGIRHRSYGWYNGFIISGGANGFLAVYNRKGQEVTSLIGHTGDVWSIAVDKNRLVSGGDDQTMKLWDLSVLQQANPPTKIYPLLNIFIAKNNEFVVWTKEGFFNASKNGAQYIGYHLNQGTNKEAFFVPVTKLYKTFHRPDLIKKALKGEDLSPYTRNISINKLLLENR